MILLSVLGIISALGNGIVPALVGKLLDALIQPASIVVIGFGQIPLWLALLFAWTLVQLVTNAVDWLFGRISRVVGTSIQSNFVIEGYGKMLTLPVSFFKHHKSGELSDLVSRSSWMLDSIVSSVFINLSPQFLSIVVGITAAFLIQPNLAWVLLAGVAIYAATIIRVVRPTAGLQAEANKRWREAYGDIADAYTNLLTVKQSGMEEREQERAQESFHGEGGAATIWNKLEYWWNTQNAYRRGLVILTQFAIFTYSATAIMHGTMTIGDLVAFNSYAGFIFGPFVSLGQQWQTVQNGLTAVAQAELIFASEPEHYKLHNSPSLEKLAGKVAFDNVHFTYEDGQPEVLKGLSFVAEPGERVAFVGETGAGKSTAAELISAYYFPNSGSVMIDGHDTKMLGLKELRAHIAVVPQEVVLFNEKIGDNIRYGRPDATNEEVREAARKAHADVFIDAFPKGYDQEVGERGVKLSVGQKQRVAIARAILRNPRILILDEPTSALDAETERYITASLEELMRGRTTFIIAHRLSTVRQADKILVLRDGKIVESGTHANLMQIPKGMYRHLYELHMGLHE